MPPWFPPGHAFQAIVFDISVADILQKPFRRYDSFDLAVFPQLIDMRRNGPEPGALEVSPLRANDVCNAARRPVRPFEGCRLDLGPLDRADMDAGNDPFGPVERFDAAGGVRTVSLPQHVTGTATAIATFAAPVLELRPARDVRPP